MDVNATVLVKDASRTLHVFEAFADTGSVISLAQLARALDIPRSSCLALVRTLCRAGISIRSGQTDTIRLASFTSWPR